MSGAYTCRKCGGTGQSQVQLGPTNGFLSAPIADRPVCAACGGTGRVPEPNQRDSDVFDLVGRLVGRLRRRQP